MKYETPNITDEKGGLHAIYPCTHYLTFGPWIYLVPQYIPDSVLMLGYAGGTASGLIHLFYGDVPVTGVDIGECFDYYGDTIIKADAKEYVKTCPKFDCVIVDLYDENSPRPCDFVTSKEFVDNLAKIANYIIVHTKEGNDMSEYNRFHHVKTLTLPYKGDILDAKFHYYMVHDIPSLPIR